MVGLRLADVVEVFHNVLFWLISLFTLPGNVPFYLFIFYLFLFFLSFPINMMLCSGCSNVRLHRQFCMFVCCCFFTFFLSSFTSQFRANILTLRIGRLLEFISLQVFSLSSVLQKPLFAL